MSITFDVERRGKSMNGSALVKKSDGDFIMSCGVYLLGAFQESENYGSCGHVLFDAASPLVVRRGRQSVEVKLDEQRHRVPQPLGKRHSLGDGVAEHACASESYRETGGLVENKKEEG